MSLSVEELKKVMANTTDEELYDALYAHSDDYTPEAIEVAKEEFRSRKLEGPTLSNVSAAVEAHKQLEDVPLDWSLRIASFFISTMFLGIPVLLAHRHYVEQGAKRKAREWGWCAFFGFLFYLTLSILIRLLPLLLR